MDRRAVLASGLALPLLAKAGHESDFKALTEALRERKAAARRAFEAVLG